MANLLDGYWNRLRIWNIVADAYKQEFPGPWNSDRNGQVITQHQRREPIWGFQLEEIMDDLGYYS